MSTSNTQASSATNKKEDQALFLALLSSGALFGTIAGYRRDETARAGRRRGTNKPTTTLHLSLATVLRLRWHWNCLPYNRHRYSDILFVSCIGALAPHHQ